MWEISSCGLHKMPCTALASSMQSKKPQDGGKRQQRCTMAGERAEKANKQNQTKPTSLRERTGNCLESKILYSLKAPIPYHGRKNRTSHLRSRSTTDTRQNLGIQQFLLIHSFAFQSFIFFFQFPTVAAVWKQMIFLLICHLTSSQEEVCVQYNKIF